MQNLLFLNLGGGEVFLILFFILLLFGGKGIPTIARTLGKSMREFRDAANGIKSDFTNGANEIRRSVDRETQIIEEEVQEVKRKADPNTEN